MSLDDRTDGSSGMHGDLRTTLRGMEGAEAEELARTWDLAALAADREPDEDATATALRRFLTVVGLREVGEADRPVRARIRVLPFLGSWKSIAAATVLVLAIAGAYTLRPHTTRIAVAPGDIEDVTLPDGSHAVVGPSSELTYRTGPLADPRHVQLDGEAFFSVTEDDRTFRVETFNATVTALGTTFNVRAPRGGRTPTTRVSLASGSVKVYPNGAEERAVWLRPGQMSEIGRSGVPTPPRRVSVEAEASWRTGGFVMINQSVDAIFDELERRYGVTIVDAVTPYGIDTLSIRLPQAETAWVVLADICALIECRSTAENGSMTVEPIR